MIQLMKSVEMKTEHPKVFLKIVGNARQGNLQQSLAWHGHLMFHRSSMRLAVISGKACIQPK
jgi:hypothetical protein